MIVAMLLAGAASGLAYLVTVRVRTNMLRKQENPSHQ